MDKYTLAVVRMALNDSINKWSKNAEATTPHEYTTGVSDCPLCLIFRNVECEGCPVFETTGEEGCNGTPYESAFLAWKTWRDLDMRGIDKVSNAYKQAMEDAQFWAEEEVGFLKSLLPEE